MMLILGKVIWSKDQKFAPGLEIEEPKEVLSLKNIIEFNKS